MLRKERGGKGDREREERQGEGRERERERERGRERTLFKNKSQHKAKKTGRRKGDSCETPMIERERRSSSTVISRERLPVKRRCPSGLRKHLGGRANRDSCAASVA